MAEQHEADTWRPTAGGGFPKWDDAGQWRVLREHPAWLRDAIDASERLAAAAGDDAQRQENTSFILPVDRQEKWGTFHLFHLQKKLIRSGIAYMVMLLVAGGVVAMLASPWSGVNVPGHVLMVATIALCPLIFMVITPFVLAWVFSMKAKGLMHDRLAGRGKVLHHPKQPLLRVVKLGVDGRVRHSFSTDHVYVLLDGEQQRITLEGMCYRFQIRRDDLTDDCCILDLSGVKTLRLSFRIDEEVVATLGLMEGLLTDEHVTGELAKCNFPDVIWEIEKALEVEFPFDQTRTMAFILRTIEPFEDGDMHRRITRYLEERKRRR